jgi:predicted DNA-binding transcriptional regulator AlpA
MRVLTFDGLRGRGVPYSREHIRRREKAGTFPQHISLGEGRIGWIEHEIDEWLADLAAMRGGRTPASVSEGDRRDKARGLAAIPEVS